MKIYLYKKLILKIFILILFFLTSFVLISFHVRKKNEISKTILDLKPSISLDAFSKRNINEKDYLIGFKSEIDEIQIDFHVNEKGIDYLFELADFRLGKNNLFYQGAFEAIDPSIIIFILKDINTNPDRISLPVVNKGGKNLMGVDSLIQNDKKEYQLLIYIDPSTLGDKDQTTSTINQIIARYLFLYSNPKAKRNLNSELNIFFNRFPPIMKNQDYENALNIIQRNKINFNSLLKIISPKIAYAQTCVGTYECGEPITPSSCEEGDCIYDSDTHHWICNEGSRDFCNPNPASYCGCRSASGGCATQSCASTTQCTNDCASFGWGCNTGMYDGCYTTGPAPTLAPGVTPSPTPIGGGGGGCDAYCDDNTPCSEGVCAAYACRCGGNGDNKCTFHDVRNDATGLNLIKGAGTTNNICLPLTTTFTYMNGIEDSSFATHNYFELVGSCVDWWNDQCTRSREYDRDAGGLYYSWTVDLKPFFNVDQTREFRSHFRNDTLPDATDNPSWCSPQIHITNSCPRDARCSGHTIPSQMYAGASTMVQVTMRNLGFNDVWSEPTFRLGSTSPENNMLWGRNRVDFPLNVYVGFNIPYTFNFQITAPSTPGTYSSKWRMLRSGGTPEWFGQSCGPNAITVLPGCPSNIQTDCSGTTLTTTWTSAPAGVTHYNFRANHSPTNNNQCLNSQNTPVGWYCPDQGDQGRWSMSDVNPSNGSETNIQEIEITPGVEYLISTNSVIYNTQPTPTPIQGCGVEEVVVCPTLTPTPTPTPAFQGHIYLDEGSALSGPQGICTQTGTIYANPAGTLTISSGSRTVNPTNNQTYSIPTDNYGSNPLSLDLSGQTADPANTFICACPVNASNPLICNYSGITSPQNNVNFYLSRYNLSNGSWWQSSGGNVYGKNGIRSYIPASTCLETNNCYPALMAKNPFNSATQNTVGFPMINAGSIITHASETHIHTANSNSSDNGRAVGTSLFEQGYDDFLSNLPTPPIPITDLNFADLEIDLSETNIFLFNNTMNIDETHGWNIPSGTNVIVFVNGDLNLEDSTPNDPDSIITVEQGGYIAFIVSQDINIHESVGYDVSNDQILDPVVTLPNVEGVFIADGTLRTESQAPAISDRRIVIAGTYVGWGGVELERSFEVTNDLLSVGRNNSNAIESFIHRPDLVTNTPIEMRSAQIIWQEVAPNY
jgi:hypothetical protein